MKRRDFLCASSAFAAFVVCGSAKSQAVGARGAVVIGVDKIQGLPVLHATDGANQVAQWLTGEGFEVKLLLDTTTKVTLQEIFDAVAEFVGRGNVSMLVIYFAGHGYMANVAAEWWMLSGAPANPNEAVSFLESVYLAKNCGIPNVVIISDACRSTPESLNAGSVRGGLIFPVVGLPSATCDVDRFMATCAGNRAYELPVAESVNQGYQGIFTGSFMDAFRRPDKDMVKPIRDGTLVVPNRALKKYLQREVQKRAQDKSIILKQLPDVEVTSDDMVYIGHAQAQVRASLPGTLLPIDTIVDFAFKKAGASFSNIDLNGENISPERELEVEKQAADVGFTQTAQMVIDDGHETSLSGTGVYVSGNAVKYFALMGPSAADVTSDGFLNVEIKDRRAENVLIRFNDGTGTVIPVISNYTTFVSLGDGGEINNVRYAPSKDNNLSSAYTQNQPRIKRLQSVFAAAAAYGTFRIEGPRSERRERDKYFREDIRIADGIDPTLSIYTGYIYADADLDTELREISAKLRDQLGIGLFDLELLSGALRQPSNAVFPSFPMMAQGWSFLRVMGAQSEQTTTLKPYLMKSPWTMFTLDGMEHLMAAAQKMYPTR
ncbi:caspase family protein [Rhizobium miluonense]|uniref:Peptidase C14 caspase domain-containing protein n=1 Tax=Rhizobium miluonense TaxID=411945 RepID=A0ABU1SYA5_9HYPH|nr:caspase family protein [Rhizobium miluonense]MDR6903863.1 hypothetical protein [Rhizobium miluonense]